MRIECEFTDIDLDDSDFEVLGAALESAAKQDSVSGLRRGQVGSATCRLIPLRLAVDFACSRLHVHRQRVTEQPKHLLSS